MINEGLVNFNDIEEQLEDYLEECSSLEIDVCKQIYSQLEKDKEIQYLSLKNFAEIYLETKSYLKNFYQFNLLEQVAWFKTQLTRYALPRYLKEAEEQVFSEQDIFSEILKKYQLKISSAQLLSIFKRKDNLGHPIFIRVYFGLKLATEEAVSCVFTEDELIADGFTKEEADLLIAINEKTTPDNKRGFVLTYQQAACLEECYELFAEKLEERFFLTVNRALNKQVFLLMLKKNQDERYVAQQVNASLTRFNFSSRIHFLLARWLRYNNYIYEYAILSKKYLNSIPVKEMDRLITVYFPRLVEESLTVEKEHYYVSYTLDYVTKLRNSVVTTTLIYIAQNNRDLTALRIEAAIVVNALNSYKIENETSLTIEQTQIIQAFLGAEWHKILRISENGIFDDYVPNDSSFHDLILKCYNGDFDQCCEQMLHQFVLPLPLLEILIERRTQVVSDELFALQHFHPQERAEDQYLRRLQFFVEKHNCSLSTKIPIFNSLLNQLVAFGYYKSAEILLMYNRSLADYSKRFDVNAETAFGFTALHIAVIAEAIPSLVTQLIDDGDIGKKTSNGLTIHDLVSFTDANLSFEDGKLLNNNSRKIKINILHIDGYFQMRIYPIASEAFLEKSKSFIEILDFFMSAVSINVNDNDYTKKLKKDIKQKRMAYIYQRFSIVDKSNVNRCFRLLKKESEKFKKLPVTLEQVIELYKELKEVVVEIEQYSFDEIYRWIEAQARRYELVGVLERAQDEMENRNLSPLYKKIPYKSCVNDSELKILFKRNSEKSARVFSKFWTWAHNQIGKLDENSVSSVSLDGRIKVVREKTMIIPAIELAEFSKQQKSVFRKLDKNKKADANGDVKLKVDDVIYLLNCYEIYMYEQNVTFAQNAIKEIAESNIVPSDPKYQQDLRMIFSTTLPIHYPIKNEKLDENILTKKIRNFEQFLLYKIMLCSAYEKARKSYDGKFGEITEKFFPMPGTDDFLSENYSQYYELHIWEEVSQQVLQEFNQNILLFLSCSNLGTRRIEWAYYVQSISNGKISNIRCVALNELEVLDVFLKTDWQHVYYPKKKTLSLKYFKSDQDNKLTFEDAIVRFFQKDYLEFIQSLLNDYLLPNELLAVLLKHYPQCIKEENEFSFSTAALQHYHPHLQGNVEKYRERLKIINNISTSYPELGNVLNYLIKKELFTYARVLLDESQTQNGLNVYAVTNEGHSALHLCLIHCAPMSLIEFLVTKHPGLLIIRNAAGESVVHLALIMGKMDALSLFLQAMKNKINSAEPSLKQELWDLYQEFLYSALDTMLSDSKILRFYNLQDSATAKEILEAKGIMEDIYYEDRSVGSYLSHICVNEGNRFFYQAQNSAITYVRADRTEFYDEKGKITLVWNELINFSLRKDIVSEQERQFLTRQVDSLDRQNLLDFYHGSRHILRNIFSYAKFCFPDQNEEIIETFEEILNRCLSFRQCIDECLSDQTKKYPILEIANCEYKVLKFGCYQLKLARELGMYRIIITHDVVDFLLKFQERISKYINKNTKSIKFKDNAQLMMKDVDYVTLLELFSELAIFEHRTQLEPKKQAEIEEEQRLKREGFTLVQSKRTQKTSTTDNNNNNSYEDPKRSFGFGRKQQ